MKPEVGDLVWDNVISELGFLIKIWTEEEILNLKLDYPDFIYELYFPESGYRDRFRNIDPLKRELEELLGTQDR